MKAYVLPTPPNHALVKILLRQQAHSNFVTLVSRLSMYLRSNKLNIHFRHVELLLFINRLYLTNVFKYTERGGTAWFVQSLTTSQIGYELNVYANTVSEFFRPFMGLGINDYDMCQIENSIAMELTSYMTCLYNDNSAEFNEVFVALFDMFYKHIPLDYVDVHRFQVTPNLTPIVFCSDKLTLPYSQQTKEKLVESIHI